MNDGNMKRCHGKLKNELYRNSKRMNIFTAIQVSGFQLHLKYFIILTKILVAPFIMNFIEIFLIVPIDLSKVSYYRLLKILYVDSSKIHHYVYIEGETTWVNSVTGRKSMRVNAKCRICEEIQQI